MSAESVQATTFRCDVDGCGATQVVAGAKPSETVTKTFGWSLGHSIFGIGMDLCKSHTDELHEWVPAKDAENGDPGEPVCCCWSINPAHGEQVCGECDIGNHIECEGPQ